MFKPILLILTIFISSSLYATKGTLKISANLSDVGIYNGKEQIAMLGIGETEIKLDKGSYHIVLKKTINKSYEYIAQKKVFVGEDTITRVAFTLKKRLTKEAKIKRDKKVSREKKILQKNKKRIKKANSSLKKEGFAYKVVLSPYTNRLWLDRNLGASRVCETSDDKECFGDYYQWGRKNDGHEKKDSSVISKISSTKRPKHDKFIKSLNRWHYLKDDKLWKYKNSKNNPCPKGFRVPRMFELEDETVKQGVKDIKSAYSNFLKLPAAGYRDNRSAKLNELGEHADIWTSHGKGQYAWSIYFTSNDANVHSNFHSYGYSLRCIKAELQSEYQ